MRVRVYIDGFNFYHRRLKHSETKWTDLKKLSKQLLHQNDIIEKIRYFTADVSPKAGDEKAPERQATYFRALRTIPELEIHKGTFLTTTEVRPLACNPSLFVRVRDTEEKGSDVNLASHLLMDAFNDTFDAALVLSQDTDLLEPLRMISTEFEKTLILGWYSKPSPGKKHREYASAVRHISNTMLKTSQFPNPVIGVGGVKIFRPKFWDFD